MKNVGKQAAFWVGAIASICIVACGHGTTSPPEPPTGKSTPIVTVTPASPSITTAQALAVTVIVTGNPTPAGAVVLSSGNYTSGSMTLSNGSVTILVPAGSLVIGNDLLTATYTPDTASSSTYNSSYGTHSVTVTAPAKTSPTVTVTPSSFSITSAQALAVTMTIGGAPVPTGSVTLTGGAYTSASETLGNGTVTIDVPAGSLTIGSDTLTATYTPDAASSSIYNQATGVSPAITVVLQSSVIVDQSSVGPPVTDQLLGMNMAAWYDPTTSAIVPALQTAGIKAVRWPGGGWSDDYHWATNTMCGSTPNPNSTFSNFVNDVATPAGLDVAITANYGTNAACNGPGEPGEAAAWAAAALTSGIHASHWTVGNEEYGAWEDDLHAVKHDPATYASAVAGANGYYQSIKAANPAALVGVSVNPGNSPAWDPVVLENAKGYYDFVEYHYYPQGPGGEDDTFLVSQAAQGLTAVIDSIKLELASAGTPGTPIYIGEIGSVWANPGKQSTSITQALYAGQVLGEMMNAGVSRATWWLAFGGCSDADTSQGGQFANFSNSLYGWQDFGGYMVFSDGLPEYGCTSAPNLPAGTLLPTARAFQLFSNVAITGERVLFTTVTGDTTDVRAYAATNNGGTALVLFNLNQTTPEPVAVTLSGQSATTGVTVDTYSKAIYDLSKSNVWSAPATTNLGAQDLPLTLTLAPWSMNVVIIK